MTERNELIRAICTNPADDTVRLVFADWLQEHGEDRRASFIRAQCALNAHLGVHYAWVNWDDPLDISPIPEINDFRNKAHELHQQEMEFRPKEGDFDLWFGFSPEDEWQYYPDGGEFPNICFRPLFSPQRVTFCIHRGFIHSMTCSPIVWLNCSEMLTWHPEQTMLCTACRGTGYVQNPSRTDELYDAFKGRKPMVPYPQRIVCSECIGTRQLQRPCPDTAQPLVDVIFTSPPDWSLVDKKRWKNIRFHLIMENEREGTYLV